MRRLNKLRKKATTDKSAAPAESAPAAESVPSEAKEVDSTVILNAVDSESPQ